MAKTRKKKVNTEEPLPKRTTAQIKEDDSKSIFIRLIKPWMVVSWLEKDYGVDGIIEITKPLASSQNQIVTGKRVSIQLKSSTIDKFNKGDFSLSVPVEKINYWMQSFEPVMIVYVDLYTESAYYRWIDDNLIAELFNNNGEWIAQESSTIKFQKTLQINTKTLAGIEKYVLSWKKRTRTLLTPGNYFKYNNEAYEYASALNNLCEQYNIQSLRKEVEELSKEVSSSIYTIAVIGLSRAGKSTLINALLEKEISPMGKLPTTGVPITIFPKDESKAFITLKNNNETIEGEANSTFLAEYTAQDKNPGNIKGVKYVQVHIINTLLERGFALCDVPGLDDADPEIKSIAKTAIYNSNAIVYVISVAGYNEGEFRINDRNIADLNDLRGRMDRVFLVFNKIDSLNKEDLSAVKVYINTILSQFGIIDFLAAPPIYISSKESFENRISKKYGSDSVSQLEQVLWDYLINQNRTGLHKILTNFGNQVETIEKLSRIANIRVESTIKRKSLENEIQKVHKEILGLRQFINDKRESIYNEINVYILDRFENVISHLNNNLKNITLNENMPNGKEIARFLEDEAYKIISDVYEFLQRESFGLQTDVNNWVSAKLKQVELPIDNYATNNQFKLPEITKYTSQVYSFFVQNKDGYIGMIESIFIGIGNALEWIFNIIGDFFTAEEKIVKREIAKIINNSRKSYNQIQTQLLQNVSNYLNGICNNIQDKTIDRTRVYLGELTSEAQKLDMPLSENDKINHIEFIDKIQNIKYEIASNFNHLKDYSDGVNNLAKTS